jgi:hypothetical protein
MAKSPKKVVKHPQPKPMRRFQLASKKNTLFSEDFSEKN